MFTDHVKLLLMVNVVGSLMSYPGLSTTTFFTM